MSFFKSTKFICSLAVAINFLISYLMLFYQQPFNVDGILYLNTANAFLTAGVQNAMTVYSWPFYSILIAFFSKLTFLSLENSAFLLNALLTAILVVAFILLVKEFGGKVNEQYFALLVILLFPYLNHSRENILRDFGYYAFLLTSLLFFVHYLRHLSWSAAINWGVSIVIAALFRVEGVFVLLLAPLIIFFKPQLSMLEKVGRYLQFNIILMLIIGMVKVFVLLFHQQLPDLGGLQALIYNATGWFLSTVNQMTAKNAVIAQSILDPIAANAAPAFMWGGLTTIFLESFCKTLGVIYLILIIYTFVKRRIPSVWEVRFALYGYGVIIFLTLFAFLIQQYFISQRYIAPLCLILILSLPFGLQNILQTFQAAEAPKKLLYKMLAVSLLVGIMVHSFIHLGVSKTYMVDAGTWITQNTPLSTKVYSNSAQVFYYSKREGMQYPKDFLPSNQLLENLQKVDFTNYDYLILWLDHKQLLTEPAAISWLKKPPIKRFSNKRGDVVLIFQLK